MDVSLTDDFIKVLLKERKPIREDYRTRLPGTPRDPSRPDHRVSMRIIADSGRQYRLWVRQKQNDKKHFSAGLMVVYNKQELRLIRCNGFHGPHKNILEGTTIPSHTCHVHWLTARYFAADPAKHDGFAEEASSLFTTVEEAIEYLVQSCGFYLANGPYRQPNPLFRKRGQHGDESD